MLCAIRQNDSGGGITGNHLRKQAASDPFDQISGSNGLMGAADTTWVMQRKRTSKNADIILTGRDLDRRTLYLHEENCIWLLDEEETAEEQRLKAVPEYLWRVAEYIEQVLNSCFTSIYCKSIPVNKLPIHLMRITINRLRNERLAKGQYTDAADDMLLKLF